MASRHRRTTSESDRGFTLIELLVVVVILGILIAIAIPVYLNYRKSANDKAAQSDLRGMVSLLEQCYSDNNAYPAAVTVASSATAVCTGRTGTVSAGTTINYYPASASDTSTFIVGATNAGGTKNYCYHSARGGSVTSTTTAVTAYRTAC